MRFKLWILSAMTILAMGLFCVPAAADTSGRCGEDVTWVLDPDTGVLTISGTGEMYWEATTRAPRLVFVRISCRS